MNDSKVIADVGGKGSPKVDITEPMLHNILMKCDMILSDVVTMKTNQQLLKLQVERMNSNMTRMFEQMSHVSDDCKHLREIRLLMIELKSSVDEVNRKCKY